MSLADFAFALATVVQVFVLVLCLTALLARLNDLEADQPMEGDQ